jgi:hypothetical protein
MSDEEEERRRRGESEERSGMIPAVIGALRMHATEILGYVAAAAGAVAVMDPVLVAATLGPHAAQWALLITGVLAIVRGRTNKLQPAAK